MIMHGMIHTLLRKFVVQNHGGDAWNAILDKADLSGKKYLTLKNYSDKETFAIVGAAVELTGLLSSRSWRVLGSSSLRI